ncbi:MAG: LysM peptidoglycan-binding domain-containing protein [Bacteroidia bacterium]
MTRNIKALLFLLAAAITNTQAQTNNTLVNPASVPGNYDPVSAILDSLVTINNVVKYQQISPFSVTTETSIPTFSDEVYADRISKINTPIPLTYNSQVKGYIDLYASRKRDLTKRVMGLSNLYFPMYEEVLEREGLPLEFKYLSIVESALNPVAQSHCGATGLWQFMFNTGKMYNLSVNSYIDERKDPYKSTVAACQYFKDMYEIYHDWLLVIASYNCGPGNVNRAIIRSGGKTDFWAVSPYLPAETRGYVPAFIAVAYLMHYTAEHNLSPIAPSITYFETDTVNVFERISFSTLAKNLDIPADVISFLNPTYKRNMIPASTDGKANVLRLPTNKITAFINNQNVINQQEQTLAAQRPDFSNLMKKSKYNPEEYEWVTKEVKKSHLVKRGETLNSIANKYSCSIAEVKKWNKLKSGKVVKGQKLNVFVDQQVAVKRKKVEKENETLANNDTSIKDTSYHLIDYINGTVPADQTTVATEIHPNQKDLPEDYYKTTEAVEEGKVVYHIVQKGDTLYGIARAQGISVQELMRYNGFTSGKQLKAGSKIKVKISNS